MTSRRLLLLLALAPLSGCWTYHTALSEFDSVTRPADANGEPEHLQYQASALRMPWVMRKIDGTGFDQVLQRLLAIEPEPQTLDNPSGFARERIQVLPWLAGDNPHRIAEVTSRLLWLADVDPNPLNRITALRGLEDLLVRLRGDPKAMVFPDVDPASRAREQTLQTTFEHHWPGARSGQSLSEADRDEYLQALAGLTERPLFEPRDQRNLIRALDVALATETDRSFLPQIKAAHGRSLLHGISMQFCRSLIAPEADVREAAASAIVVAGGPEAVAFLLFLIAKPTTSASEGRNRYDDSPEVRMALVRFCAQLTPELVTKGWREGPEPVEFLYDVVREEPPAGGLRVAALEAMAFALRLPVSPDRAWANAWWDAHVRRRSTN